MTYTYHCIVRIIFNVHLIFFLALDVWWEPCATHCWGNWPLHIQQMRTFFLLQKYEIPYWQFSNYNRMEDCHWQRLLAIPWMPPGSFLCKPFTAKPWHASNKNGNLSSPLHSQTHFSKHQQERNQWRTRWSNSEKEILTLATHNGNYCEVLLPLAASQGDGQHVGAIIQTGSQRYKKKTKPQEQYGVASNFSNRITKI